MRSVEIYTEVLPSAFRWTPDSFCGGTIEFAVELAECLFCNDYEVTVYYDGPAKEHRGVYYLPRELYRGDGIVVACNSRPPHLGKRNIYWTSLFTDQQEKYLDFDERIVLSKFHQSLFGENSKVIPLACWPHLYKGTAKVPGQCLYSSSPDRGLDFLLSIWDEVHSKTGAVLHTAYGSSKQQRGVVNHGRLSKEQMIDLDRTSQFWLHPCQGIELFCVAGYKAQASGAIPVVVPNMALEETVRFGVKTDLARYKDDLIATIKNPPKVPKLDFWDWDDVANQVAALF